MKNIFYKENLIRRVAYFTFLQIPLMSDLIEKRWVQIPASAFIPMMCDVVIATVIEPPENHHNM